MLLKHTVKDITQREALMINPAKTCQPIGAMYAALGIHACLPHSHGSQGCCAYHRSMLTRHYKEPVMAATSSFTEGASVFGGQANLIQAINNIFTIYDPEVIGIHTTCLSETIGDDVGQIVSKARDEGKIPEGRFVFCSSTPSYSGSHITGYASMTKAMVDHFSQKTGFRENKINIIPGFVEPSDMEEIKRIADLMGVRYIMFPDTSGVLNGPQTGKYRMFPSGGTTVDELMETGDSYAAIGLGAFATESAVKTLNTKLKMPGEVLPLPLGLVATDRFISSLQTICSANVPDSLKVERGQLLDVITDMHQYFYGTRVAVAGDPDHVLSLVEFLLSIDMKPVHVITGTPGKAFEKKMDELTSELNYRVNYRAGGDLYLFHQWIKNEPVDLIIGNSHTKYIAREEDIPIVRFGFPIVDRIGHSYFPIFGYRGGLRLLEKILDALLNKAERDAPDESFEFVL